MNMQSEPVGGLARIPEYTKHNGACSSFNSCFPLLFVRCSRWWWRCNCDIIGTIDFKHIVCTYNLHSYFTTVIHTKRSVHSSCCSIAYSLKLRVFFRRRFFSIGGNNARTNICDFKVVKSFSWIRFAWFCKNVTQTQTHIRKHKRTSTLMQKVKSKCILRIYRSYLWNMSLHSHMTLPWSSECIDNRISFPLHTAWYAKLLHHMTEQEKHHFNAFLRCFYSRRCRRRRLHFSFMFQVKCAIFKLLLITFTRNFNACIHFFFFRELLVHYKKLIQDANSIKYHFEFLFVPQSVVVIIVVHCVQHKLNNAVHLERQRTNSKRNTVRNVWAATK